MTKNRVCQMRRTKENEEEYVVPNFLGIVMRWSQIILVAPVRLRCVDGRWAVTISPGLIIFQRFLVLIIDLAILLTLSHDFFAMFDYLSYKKTNTLNTILFFVEILVPMVIYNLRVLYSPWKIKRNISLLRQMVKIKSTFKSGTNTVSEGSQAWLAVAYVAWILIAYIFIMFWRIIDCFNNGISVVAFIYPLYFYQSLVIVVFQLEWSLIINEVRSTASMLNDELHSWLETPTVTIPPTRQNFVLPQNFATNKIHTTEPLLTKGVKTRNFGPIVHTKASLSHLSERYFQICDMVRKINCDNGPFLVSIIAMQTMSFMVATYSLMIGIGLEDTWEITWMVIWCLISITQLLSLVEPCHRLQEQLKLTRLLVSKLAGETDRWDLDPAQLEPFLLQMHMKSPVLEPMGMFTIARRMIAVILSGAAANLIMIIQFRKLFERV